MAVRTHVRRRSATGNPVAEKLGARTAVCFTARMESASNYDGTVLILEADQLYRHALGETVSRVLPAARAAVAKTVRQQLLKKAALDRKLLDLAHLLETLGDDPP